MENLFCERGTLVGFKEIIHNFYSLGTDLPHVPCCLSMYVLVCGTEYRSIQLSAEALLWSQS